MWQLVVDLVPGLVVNFERLQDLAMRLSDNDRRNVTSLRDGQRTRVRRMQKAR